MAGSASISGLASGLDTATIVSQLMQLEAVPQSRLRTKVSTQESAVKVLQDLNTKLAALTAKAEALAGSSAWSPVTATSSSDKVTVTTTSGATATSLAFTVESTAKAHQVVHSRAAALTDVVVTGGTTVRVARPDGTSVDVETGDGTLKGLLTAINADSSLGLRATTIQDGSGLHRLRVESVTAGSASDFSLVNGDGSALLGAADVIADGSDAVLRLGANTTITSASNQFADLVPGVTITLSPDTPAGTSVVSNVSTDSAKVSADVKALVEALNAVLTEIDTATKVGGVGTSVGPLGGDSGLRAIRDQLVNTLYSSAGTGLASVGVQLDRSGKFAFDEKAFAGAYAADPVGTAAQFTAAPVASGDADRLAKAADRAGDPFTGAVSGAIKGRKDAIERLNDDIDRWDTRLELRRTTLTRQYTALETALGRMNSQSSWLAGQISSLPTRSS